LVLMPAAFFPGFEVLIFSPASAFFIENDLRL
jgi:hypothetical protein